MGNCLSWEASSSSGSSSAPSITKIAATYSLCQGLPSTSILPFATLSNLSAIYVLGAELGRGQSSIIRQCTSRSSGVVFACKSISKLHLCSAYDAQDVVREVRIMKYLSDPIHSPASLNATVNCTSSQRRSIVCLHDVVEDKAFVHLIMELCSGGELFHRIMRKKCYSEAQAAFIMKSLLEAVQFCHSMGVMHRDIKPENILLVEDSDTSSIKLADFGLALEVSQGQKLSGMAGSSYYIAPEVLQGEYSKEVDLWSVGVIMYVLLSGVPPFRGATEQGIFKAIQKGDLSFPPSLWDKISSPAKDMITQLLHADARFRLTPLQALKHPWILLHTQNFEYVRSELTFNDAGSLGIHTTSFSPVPTQKNAKPQLSEILVEVIMSSMNSLGGRKMPNGWTCSVISWNGNEETLVVDMGEEKYLVSHDRTKKKIGWKQLKEKPVFY